MNNKIMYNGQVLVDFDALADKYTRAEVDALVSSIFKYKGTVATYADLEAIPSTDLAVGDCYNVTADGNNYAWTGTDWDKLSGTVDLSNYYTKTQVDNLINSIDLSAYYTKTQVDSKVSTDIAAAITAIPVSDLLHFKGHVNSVEDLPSTGQPSASVVNPNAAINSLDNLLYYKVDNIKTNILSMFNNTGKQYFFGGGYWHSDSYNRIYTLITTDYPECIDGIYNTGSVLCLHINYDADKPVYVTFSASIANTGITLYGDNGTNNTYQKGTSNALITNSGFLFTMCFGSNTSFLSNLSSLKYKKCSTNSIQSYYYPNSTSTNNKYNTITATLTDNSSYTWDENSYLYAFGADYYPKLVTSETDTKLNEVYSVGTNNLLYRRNENIAWELLSKQDKPVIVTYNSANNTADYNSAQIKTALDADTPVYLHVEQINGVETINLLLPFVYADDTEAQAVLSNSYSSSGNESSSTITYSIDANGDGTMYNVANVTNGELSDALEDYLATDNTTPYTPTGDYNPATKKYVDTSVGNLANDISTLLSNFAPNYDNTSTYAVNDYVIYNKLLYICTTAVDTAEDFDSSKWTRTTVSQMINNNA